MDKKNNLLIITQKVDKNDSVLGFFHGWLEEFSKNYDSVTVIALEVYNHKLPSNVRVFSLGKETGKSRLKYLYRFYKYILTERKSYYVVFVHMNQEYVLLGSLVWKILGKKIFFWRNHPNGSILTTISSKLSNKVFYTSKFSFVARYKNAVIMPAGIDTEFFCRDENINKRKGSILYLGRLSKIKKPGILIEAFNFLHKQGIKFSASLVGEAISDAEKKDLLDLKRKVSEYGLDGIINFLPAVPHWETKKFYNENEIYVNLTVTGSLDKTIVESMVCESFVLTSNRSFEGEINNIHLFKENDVSDLALKLKSALSLTSPELSSLGGELRSYAVKKHSLKALISGINKNVL